MTLVCLDLEGVLAPELWVELSKARGIPQLSCTTRDIPDYTQLMRHRLALLQEHGLKLSDLQEVFAEVEPLPGAVDFLDTLRTYSQVILLSDTFQEFTTPLMEKLHWPTLFCHSLQVTPQGDITDFQLRCPNTKETTVRAFQSIGYDTIAAGDSYNDLGMLQASRAGFLFRAPPEIRASHPHIPAYHSFQDLLQAITAALQPFGDSTAQPISSFGSCRKAVEVNL